MSLNEPRARIEAIKARTATRWAVNTLLWVAVLTALGVAPALVIAGWRWFL